MTDRNSGLTQSNHRSRKSVCLQLYMGRETLSAIFLNRSIVKVSGFALICQIARAKQNRLALVGLDNRTERLRMDDFLHFLVPNYLFLSDNHQEFMYAGLIMPSSGGNGAVQY